MDLLKKEYRQAKLNLGLAIIEQHFSDWGVDLDEKIKRVIYLLNFYGFNTTLSCEGHIPPYSKVDTFRLFWPYVQINLLHSIKLHLEEKKPRMETAVGDMYYNLRKLKFLIDEFNSMDHPFSEKNLEMGIVLTDGITTLKNSLQLHEVLQNHWNVHILICDVGVQGILAMPQELLNDEFRKEFLKRTQHQMEFFTSFLEWRAVGYEE